MWLDGEIVNRPSDGQERRVANGLVMMVLDPVQHSELFSVGEPVRTIAEVGIRVGPGDNYAAYTTLDEGELGLVLPHLNRLNGVHARGTNWWRVAFDNKWGWVAEDSLETDLELADARLSVFGSLLRPPGHSDSESGESQ